MLLSSITALIPEVAFETRIASTNCRRALAPSQLSFIAGAGGCKLYDFLLNSTFELRSPDHQQCAEAPAEVTCHSPFRQSILRLVYPDQYPLLRELGQQQVEKAQIRHRVLHKLF